MYTPSKGPQALGQGPEPFRPLDGSKRIPTIIFCWRGLQENDRRKRRNVLRTSRMSGLRSPPSSGERKAKRPWTEEERRNRRANNGRGFVPCGSSKGACTRNSTRRPTLPQLLVAFAFGDNIHNDYFSHLKYLTLIDSGFTAWTQQRHND